MLRDCTEEVTQVLRQYAYHRVTSQVTLILLWPTHYRITPIETEVNYGKHIVNVRYIAAYFCVLPY